jgi:hypothetical protein
MYLLALMTALQVAEQNHNDAEGIWLPIIVGVGIVGVIFLYAVVCDPIGYLAGNLRDNVTAVSRLATGERPLYDNLESDAEDESSTQAYSEPAKSEQEREADRRAAIHILSLTKKGRETLRAAGCIVEKPDDAID